MKKLYEKYKEVILYLVFGVITTLVGWGLFYGTMLLAEYVFGINLSDKNGLVYTAIYTFATILQWLGAVLTAFYTNRMWVFADAKKDQSVWRQLLKFAGGRVATLFLEWILGFIFINLTDAFLLHKGDLPVDIFGLYTLKIDAEMISKVIVGVIIVITNYVISKLFVFKKKK